MNLSKLFAAASALLLGALMILIFMQVSWPVADPDATNNTQIGQALFGTEQDPGFSPLMIMIAIVLLVALLGAVFLAKEDEEGEP